MATPDVLLGDYNAYRLHTGNVRRLSASGARVVLLKAKPERVQALQAMADWCETHRIDPRLWLYSLFNRRRWLFAPPFHQLTPEKHLDVWQQYTGNPELLRQRLAQERVALVPQGAQGHDLVPALEAQKHALVRTGRAALCRDAFVGVSQGFHPRSTACQECAVSEECQRRLRERSGAFDVVGFRAAGGRAW